MSTISILAQAKKKAKTGQLREAFTNSKGAIDLASIMVGIIVIGLIGGVIAATVFAVIPWAQDNAAKQQLDSVVAAQNAYRGLNTVEDGGLRHITENPNTYGLLTDGDSQLAQAGLMTPTPETYCSVPAASGESFNAYVQSATGRVFSATANHTKPFEVSAEEAACLQTAPPAGGGAGGGFPDGYPATTDPSEFYLFRGGLAAEVSDESGRFLGSAGLSYWCESDNRAGCEVYGFEILNDYGLSDAQVADLERILVNVNQNDHFAAVIDACGFDGSAEGAACIRDASQRYIESNPGGVFPGSSAQLSLSMR